MGQSGLPKLHGLVIGMGWFPKENMFPKGIRDAWQVKVMPSLLRSLALTLKMLNTRKPHNSAIVGIVMLPEYRKTPENSKTDTSDCSGVRNKAWGWRWGTCEVLPRGITRV